jgi:transcriptional regulator with XRE-family HTH domain
MWSVANIKSASVVSPLPVRRALRDLGADVQAWRKLRGLTQAQLGDRAGVARQTVARLERGDGVVSFEIVLRLLNSLGVLGNITQALDPYQSDVGRLRSDEQLPQRVRPRDLTRSDRG